MKKNVTPLKRLLAFLKDQMRHGTKHLDLPLLIIDDEADNASVNAKKDENPAAINKLIRELIEQFKRASYVGYTATPFANIFINPDPERNDLFPNNFIYSLKAPTNYIGAASVFSEGGNHSGQLVEIDDAESAFPKKHGKNLDVVDLPNSLEDAIGVFLLSCAIRDLRNEPLKHRSMLVNVSRFTQVQSAVAERVRINLYALQTEIKQYMAADAIWQRHAALARLHELYAEHYEECGFSWGDVRKKLFDSVASIKVLTINQQTESEDKLNYRKYRNTEKGRRVIAIGGLTLSRGLTLEGLCVSYFYRHSKAYDTLLQMGRWFGYRPGYEDLCRIWMTAEAQGWFALIADVVSELRFDIRHMHTNRLPPIKFGMRVRSHPDTLLVTAKNKMRNSDEVEIPTSFSGRGTETSSLANSSLIQKQQAIITSELLTSLGPASSIGNRHIWRNVPCSTVAAYLQKLEISPLNQSFMHDAETKEQPLIEFIRVPDVQALEHWDICVPQGQGSLAEDLSFIGAGGHVVQVKKRERQFERSRRLGSTYITTNRQRVGDIFDEKVDLDFDEVKAVELEWEADPANRGKRVPGRAFRARRVRPLLTIHPIEPVDPRSNRTKNEKGIHSPEPVEPTITNSKNGKSILPRSKIEPDLLIAISLSFPEFEETEKSSVTYRINKVYLQNIGLIDKDDDENEDSDENLD